LTVGKIEGKKSLEGPWLRWVGGWGLILRGFKVNRMGDIGLDLSTSE